MTKLYVIDEITLFDGTYHSQLLEYFLGSLAAFCKHSQSKIAAVGPLNILKNHQRKNKIDRFDFLDLKKIGIHIVTQSL